MLNKSARNVVIIGGIKSDLIEQAIFILKTDGTDKRQATALKKDGAIVREAERIIDSYIQHVDRLTDQAADMAAPVKPRKLVPPVVVLGIAVAVGLALFMIMKLIFSF